MSFRGVLLAHGAREARVSLSLGTHFRGGSTIYAVVADYDSGKWRPIARTKWADWCSHFPEASKVDIPGYWLDRLGFRLAVASEAGHEVSTRGFAPIEWQGSDFVETLGRWARETSGVSGYPPRNWDEPIGHLPFAGEIVDAVSGCPWATSRAFPSKPRVPLCQRISGW